MPQAVICDYGHVQRGHAFQIETDYSNDVKDGYRKERPVKTRGEIQANI